MLHIDFQGVYIYIYKKHLVRHKRKQKHAFYNTFFFIIIVEPQCYQKAERKYHLIFQTCGRRHPPIYSWTANAHCPNIHQNGSQSSSNPKHHLDPNISAGACKMVASVTPWHFTVESECLQALSPAVMEMIRDRLRDSQRACILMRGSASSVCEFVC